MNLDCLVFIYPNGTRVYKHPSGMVLHTETNRVEAFKLLMSRAVRNGGWWWLGFNGTDYVVMSMSRGMYKGFELVAKCNGAAIPPRVQLMGED